MDAACSVPGCLLRERRSILDKYLTFLEGPARFSCRAVSMSISALNHPLRLPLPARPIRYRWGTIHKSASSRAVYPSHRLSFCCPPQLLAILEFAMKLILLGASWLALAAATPINPSASATPTPTSAGTATQPETTTTKPESTTTSAEAAQTSVEISETPKADLDNLCTAGGKIYEALRSGEY